MTGRPVIGKSVRSCVSCPASRWRRIAPLLVVSIILVLLFAATGCGVGGGTNDGEGGTSSGKGGSMFSISSPAFESGGLIPVQYANNGFPGGKNMSIPYEWRGAPAATKSYALVLIDKSPIANEWVHWIVYDIPGSVTALPAGASGSGLPDGAKELQNTFGALGYGGPQPPALTGKHPYEATLYALDVGTLPVAAGSDRAELERAMRGHVLDTASMTGNLGR